MSIARAFTTRRVKQSLTLSEAEVLPHRSNTTKGSISSVRPKISAPVELIYTTNMLAYHAPDIKDMKDVKDSNWQTASSTSSSHRSDDDSDASPTAASTPPTSPDTPSPSPEPNHLSCYFTVPGQTAPVAAAPHSDAPVVPQRAASHGKRVMKSYESLVRQRSNSRSSEQSQRTLSSKGSFSFSRSSSASTSTTTTSLSSPPPYHKSKMSASSITSPLPSAAPLAQFHRKGMSQAQHPFGPELAQVSEIAEEYGVKEQLNEFSIDEQEMAAKGLLKFSADQYSTMLRPLFDSFFNETKPMATTMWI